VRSTVRWVLLGAVTVLALAGCGAGTAADGGDAAGPPAPDGTPPAGGDPVELVGLWTVREAAGEEPGAILRLADRGLSLWRKCGHLDGAWAASTDGLFVGHVFGGSGACVRAPDSGPDSGPAWLKQAAGHRADGRDRLLVDRAGRPVARLVPGGRPEVDANTAASEAEPPVVTADLRDRLSPAAPLPAGLRPASAAELAGRWVPVRGAGGRSPQPPHVELRADGSWSGSDGCNGQGGRWVAGAGGAVLAVAGAQTLIGCTGVNVGSWLTDAARAGFAGDELVLLDRAGRELGRLRAG
jgi:antitoxin (DNA-binding transcriptional repressor) of toxin-antitoxin stability system